MHINFKVVQKHDLGLITTTVIAILLFAMVAINLIPHNLTEGRISNFAYLKQGEKSLDFDTILEKPPSNWTSTNLPVNFGISPDVYWFSFTISPTPNQHSEENRLLLQINYALLDKLDVAIYSNVGSRPYARYFAGDTVSVDSWPIAHATPLFPLPSADTSQRVVIRAETTGSLRLPLALWEESKFIEYNASQTLALGLFFGILCAMGISNLFIFITTKNRAFLYYSGYVFSLALTLTSLHGFGYAYLWPDQAWFQNRATIIFANATALLGVLFTRYVLPIAAQSQRLDLVLRGVTWIFGLSIIFNYLFPYALMIKLYLAMLSFIVLLLIFVSGWLAIKGIALARYFAIAWAFLFISCVVACLDNLNILSSPVSVSYLLIIGGAVESLILALILAISYSHSRDEFINTQQFALTQEIEASRAKEELLAVQKSYQDDLEYKVEERTLELEIALRELSEVNQELERLTAIDPLTGINNRRHFDKRLKSEGRRSRREQTPLTLAIIDADHFKTVNDKYGHSGGDACLIHITGIIQSMINRPTDDLCRIGGEEFALILPNTDENGAKHVMGAIRERIEATPAHFEGNDINLTVSAGVVTAVIEDDEQPRTLFRLADEQLYAAKTAGRNRVIYHRITG